ncbi:3-hydroxybenzoate 6-hydroxylase 1 [Rhodoplanes serenus]|uniref:3-hydroxybenzoate 6-hydroxylase 1 n=1 Tax=Rhodoplanes serenus TaxID=200615 RepID=A0A3S4AZ81_9BRAD|nr:3-hydroxybenzoate 6-hydroxylase 1 [Rhodoplanes serenus]
MRLAGNQGRLTPALRPTHAVPPASRTIIVAGAGIGGLTAAIALADRGFRVVVLEQATVLEATGAGIQLSPNAMRVLIGLGAAPRLEAVTVTPEAVRVRRAATGSEIVRLPVGDSELRYGAPYRVIHRGDLQAVLLALARQRPDIALVLGMRVDDYAVHRNGVTVACSGADGTSEHSGLALIGADGLWSRVRARLIGDAPPRPAYRTAWRALLPADAVEPALRAPIVDLWLGPGAHLVHYPVRGGRLINVVAIAHDREAVTGWSAPGDGAALLTRLPARSWAPAARDLLARPEQWLRWALYDRPPLARWSRGPVTLLGDAAHPMLPFLAQGAAMAIEDAAELADALALRPGDPVAALADYETRRRRRTAAVRAGARRNDRGYHLGGPAAAVRDLGMRMLGGDRLLARHDWIYGWHPRGGDVPVPAPADATAVRP